MAVMYKYEATIGHEAILCHTLYLWMYLAWKFAQLNLSVAYHILIGSFKQVFKVLQLLYDIR